MLRSSPRAHPRRCIVVEDTVLRLQTQNPEPHHTTYTHDDMLSPLHYCQSALSNLKAKELPMPHGSGAVLLVLRLPRDTLTNLKMEE